MKQLPSVQHVQMQMEYCNIIFILIIQNVRRTKNEIQKQIVYNYWTRLVFITFVCSNDWLIGALR